MFTARPTDAAVMQFLRQTPVERELKRAYWSHMWPYLLLIAPPSGAALMSVRRSGALILAVGVLYWFFVGWRFKVGVDWNNYLVMYNGEKDRPLGDLITVAEPAFNAVIWLASVTGGGLILVNAVAALVFLWGFFAMAKKCREPFLAITYATPLVVVVVAMSGIRQSMAMGVVYYLFATWDKRSTPGRAALVLFASLFHFSAIFNGIFVALGSRLSTAARGAVAMLIAAATMGLLWLFPARFEFYTQAYVGETAVTAPGALAHVALLAAPALVYLALRGRWRQVLGESLLLKYLAIAALLTIPATYFSSVAASRFSFYFWPVAMYVVSGMPALLRSEPARFLYRAAVATASVILLIAWLQLSNSGAKYVPYQNWFWVSEYEPLLRREF